jgi:hypothetical protein
MFRACVIPQIMKMDRDKYDLTHISMVNGQQQIFLLSAFMFPSISNAFLHPLSKAPLHSYEKQQECNA